MAYLKSLDSGTRLARMRAILDLKAFCFVYTNGQKPTSAEVKLIELEDRDPFGGGQVPSPFSFDQKNAFGS